MENKQKKGATRNNKIIPFQKIVLERNKKKDCTCSEKQYEVDVNNERVTCLNCGAVMSPTAALVALGEIEEEKAEHQNEWIRYMEALEREVEKMERKKSELEREAAAAEQQLSAVLAELDRVERKNRKRKG